MDGWAGLGGVRYVPENINDADSDQSKQDLNKLNIEIVDKLRATDAAFSIGIIYKIIIIIFSKMNNGPLTDF